MTFATLSRSMILLNTIGFASSALADVIVFTNDPGGAWSCLSGDGSDGDPLVVRPCNANTGQHWRLRSDGALQLVGTSECANIPNGNTANGTGLILWTCDPLGWNAMWQHSGNELINPTSGKCIDIPNGNTSYGTQVILWGCQASWNQLWNFHYVP